MRDGFGIGVLRSLNRLGGQLMTETAFCPALIEFCICKMAEVACRLSYLKMFTLRFVLMAGRAIQTHPCDLVLFLKMGLMNEWNLLGIGNLFTSKRVSWFSMTRDGQASSIGYLGYCFYGLPSQLKIGKMTGWGLLNMTVLAFWKI